MKTLKFLKDFRGYSKGLVKNFQSDHKADSILLVPSVAEVVDTNVDLVEEDQQKDKVKEYPNKMMESSDLQCKDCDFNSKSKSGLKRHVTTKHT